MAIEQIEQLRLQRRAGTIGVEVGEKRVVGILAHDRRIETGGEAFGQSGLASANRTVDCDVVEVQAAEKYIRIFMRRALAPCLFPVLAARCASAPPLPPAPPSVSFETKMSWIVRLE